MTRLAPQKIELLNSLVSEISRNYARGRVIVGVDGIADTAEFADDLAEALKNAGRAAFRASMRNFREPRVLRYSAGSLPTSDTYDIETLHRVLIDPFRDGGTGSFVLAAYDAERDAPIEPKWITAKADALLIVDFPEIIAAFAPRPFLASSPIGDSNFEVSGVKDSIAAAHPIYELLGAADAIQANYPNCAHDFPEVVREVTYKFFDKHLRGK